LHQRWAALLLVGSVLRMNVVVSLDWYVYVLGAAGGGFWLQKIAGSDC
jgi:hypothetical protein